MSVPHGKQGIQRTKVRSLSLPFCISRVEHVSVCTHNEGTAQDMSRAELHRKAQRPTH